MLCKLKFFYISVNIDILTEIIRYKIYYSDMSILVSNCSFALLKASNIFLDIFSVSTSTADAKFTNRDNSICKVIANTGFYI